MKKLQINLPHHSYPIFISAWDVEHSIREIKKRLQEDRLFIVTNHKIKKLYENKINKLFKKHFKITWLSIPDGEKHKNLSTCESLLVKLSKHGASRKSTVLALGGGVIGDITGFVASMYMRGIAYLQMPTSLLAQVDSSVGGKTGVDLSTGKNLAGSFYQPQAVFIHSDFLKTLPKREIRCGLAEVIKYGCIWDAKLFDFLAKNSKSILRLDPQKLSYLIYECCRIKCQVVQKDEKESGLRAILNYGHTLGHSIELLEGFKKYKHGEAVAMGMVFAAHLSFELGLSKVNHKASVTNILKQYNLPTKWPNWSKNQYSTAIQRDKKANGKNIKFILMQKIGKVKIQELEPKLIVSKLS
jgi:3-dehydroquinate synthase